MPKPTLERTKVRLKWRAYRLAKLIELNVPSIILVQEIQKLQDQMSKWHFLTFNQLLITNHELREENKGLKP